jgi:hypothetical protein
MNGAGKGAIMAITANRFFSTDPRCLTPEIEDRFFTDLKTRNNTFKRTASDRFRDLDDHCVAHFEQAGSDISQVLDIGVSSGSTTLALQSRLAAAGQRAHVTGTDLSLSGYLVPIGPCLRVLADEQGHPLQYELLGMGVRAWHRRADYLTGMVLVRRMLEAVSRTSLKRQIQSGGPGIREVRLLSPRLAGHPDIHVEKDDIFQHNPAFDGRFDFIRAANILNNGYFDEKAIRAALANILRYLSGPGAWLLVARSSARETASTLFRLTSDERRLTIVERIGRGSEIERLVLSTPFPLRRAEG